MNFKIIEGIGNNSIIGMQLVLIMLSGILYRFRDITTYLAYTLYKVGLTYSLQRTDDLQLSYRCILWIGIKISLTKELTLCASSAARALTRWLHCVWCPQYNIRLEAVGYPYTSCLLPAYDET